MSEHPTNDPLAGDVTAPQTTPALLAQVASRYGDDPGVVDGDVALTWAQLAGRAAELARAVAAHGIEAGDRVAIWAPNCWEWVVAVLGLHSAGAVLVPINTRYRGEEAAHLLERSQARLLFTVGEFLGTDYLALLGDRRPAVTDTVVVLRSDADTNDLTTGETQGGAVLDLAMFLGRAGEVADAEIDARIAALDGDSPSDILFTSGTTGQPKGAVCTHGQVVRAYAAWANVVGLTHDDRYLVVSPFFHAFGYKAGIIAAMTVGSPIYPEPVFDVNKVMERVAAEQISMLPGPPTLYQSMLNHPDLDTEALAGLRLAVTGAASVPVELIEAMGDTLGFETVITGYGLTEACGIATMCRDGDDPMTIATTSGRAIPGVEVVTFDEAGNPTAAGVSGEVRIRGYNVMVGYLDDPEATAETIDADGWLATGDIGVLDADGNLAITDRLKDMFIVGGFNAYPAEIERQLLLHPDVAQAAVIGVPDGRLGEVGYAFVVPTAGVSIDGAAIIAWCREHLANFKVPRYVESIDELPFNAGGKVMKFQLRDRAAETLGDHS
ncbi:FadD3 family acyl-CoA ligase [Candidatus Microthrix parvicella]|uniref:Putative AMP-dependent synthetase and ligase n=1 Tax=Candidatus Neomicrothrix parvicella RN1 TaxID=1229780 RepID=R4Z765_9ACTN|nr:FadD3 family acyl-CoA ligase [Candidatus Microthrix parvicella]CCM65941.1 putative AMP-dependent synthetase and ligase [Candidatus Microthrix parvicella RN1]